MKLGKAPRETLTQQGKGITLLGDCVIGHPRRCPQVEIEPGVCISQGVHLEAAFLGGGSFLGEKVKILSAEEIGRFATISEGCRIGVRSPDASGELSLSYPVREKDLSWCRQALPIKEPWKRKGPRKTVRIGNDVYLGEGCIIPQGIQIGDGALLYPGTLPLEDVPAYGILRGNPGQLLGFRFPPKETAQLLELKWWEFGTRLLDLVPTEKRTSLNWLLENAGTLRKEALPLPKGERGFLFLHKEGKNIIYQKENHRRNLLWQFPG